MPFSGAIRNLQVRYFVDHDPDYRKTIFLAGFGRSGTTWLLALLNDRHEFRVLFEPFDPAQVALAVNFTDHQYLRPDDDDPHFVMPATAILTGRIRDDFVDQYNRRMLFHRRIAKEVRANMYLAWLHHHFPGMPIVLLIRHPFAVAASRDAVGAHIDLQRAFLSQPHLVEDHLQPFLETLDGCRTPFEKSVATWCVENRVALATLKPGDAHVVFYERLCTAPEQELRSICSHIGVRYRSSMLKKLRDPSHTTLERGRLREDWSAGAARMCAAWSTRVAADDVRRGLEIVQAFGLSHLYDASPMPLLDAGSVLSHGIGDRWTNIIYH